MDTPTADHSPPGAHSASAPTALQLRAQLSAMVLERAYERREQAFQLTAGGFSHDYVDMRRGVARGEDLALAARTVIEVTRSLEIAFDAIGGMTMGADPVAHAVALLANKQWFSVRKAEKTHGSKRRIEGANLDSSMKVLVFEDTVTTGRSLLEALED